MDASDALLLAPWAVFAASVIVIYLRLRISSRSGQAPSDSQVPPHEANNHDSQPSPPAAPERAPGHGWASREDVGRAPDHDRRKPMRS